MANKLDNLKSFDKMDKEKQRKIASMGGKARGEKLRKRKELKEELLALLDIVNDDGHTIQEKVSLALIKEASKGNVRAFEVLRDTIGQKPKEIIEHQGEINNPYSNLSEEELKKLAGE